MAASKMLASSARIETDLGSVLTHRQSIAVEVVESLSLADENLNRTPSPIGIVDS